LVTDGKLPSFLMHEESAVKRGQCCLLAFCRAIESLLAPGGVDGLFPLLRSRYT
jgi:hypothetical protein